jgi:hypothetical protein
MAAAKRTALVCLLSIVLALAITGTALAFPLVNVPSTHQAATLNTINNRPNLVSVVLGVWPAFYVQGGYGGMAWPGHIDVGTARYTGKAYTDHVAHEWGHEVNLALDALGRNCTGRYLALLRSKGWTPTDVQSKHSFTECLSEYYFGPYYANAADTPYKVTKAELLALLQACGVTP